MRWAFLAVSIGTHLFAEAQVVVKAYVVQGDTMPIGILPEVVKSVPLSTEARRERARMISRIKTVMPYAKMTAFQLQEVEQQLQLITSKKERKKFVKEKEKQLKEQFKKRLENLSPEEGKMLVKLINRETGTTVYEILDAYTGSTEKFFWTTFSSFWSYDLKATYDPVEDYQIEAIVKSLGYE